jgi:hypothetical protein
LAGDRGGSSLSKINEAPHIPQHHRGLSASGRMFAVGALVAVALFAAAVMIIVFGVRG